MKKLLPYGLIITLVTIIFGTIYGVTQQVLRLNANDPQIQLALDIGASIDRGADPKSLIKDKVNITKSLAPFIIIYDHVGNVVAGSGYLNDSVPTVPVGVLKASGDKPYNAVTWQPQDDLRVASVSVKAGDYYVLSGRSLKEVENRVDIIGKLVLLGWIFSITSVIIYYFLRV